MSRYPTTTCIIKTEGFEMYVDEERGDFTFIEARETVIMHNDILSGIAYLSFGAQVILDSIHFYIMEDLFQIDFIANLKR
jgi:hypothetical protein